MTNHDYARFLKDVRVYLAVPYIRVIHPMDVAVLGADEAAEILEQALTLLAAGHGRSPDDPLRGLGVEGFYCLVRALQCRVTIQSAQPVGDGAMLDAMTIQGSDLQGTYEVVLYNLVEQVCPA